MRRVRESFSSCNSYKLCDLLGCLFAVPGLNESKQESKGVGVFPSRKAKGFPAPSSFLSLCTQRAPADLPVLARHLQSPVVLLSVCLCCVLVARAWQPGALHLYERGWGVARSHFNASLIHAAQNASPAPSFEARHPLAPCPHMGPLGFSPAKLSVYLCVSFKHILSVCGLLTQALRPSCKLALPLAMFCRGLAAHERGCSFPAPSFPLSHTIRDT